mmetsp:Transcript_62521/g.165906  ORF Transcript_62521/g.165906 Transcript_62521/m.165906 type:complete len:288 (+) Transcript_62521:1500-2363(+)
MFWRGLKTRHILLQGFNTHRGRTHHLLFNLCGLVRTKKGHKIRHMVQQSGVSAMENPLLPDDLIVHLRVHLDLDQTELHEHSVVLRRGINLEGLVQGCHQDPVDEQSQNDNARDVKRNTIACVLLDVLLLLDQQSHGQSHSAAQTSEDADHHLLPTETVAQIAQERPEYQNSHEARDVDDHVQPEKIEPIFQCKVFFFYITVSDKPCDKEEGLGPDLSDVFDNSMVIVLRVLGQPEMSTARHEHSKCDHREDPTHLNLAVLSSEKRTPHSQQHHHYLDLSVLCAMLQ